jgi:hypothetical protein
VLAANFSSTTDFGNDLESQLARPSNLSADRIGSRALHLNLNIQVRERVPVNIHDGVINSALHQDWILQHLLAKPRLPGLRRASNGNMGLLARKKPPKERV